jgi:hypothetical protein
MNHAYYLEEYLFISRVFILCCLVFIISVHSLLITTPKPQFNHKVFKLEKWNEIIRTHGYFN